MSSVLSYTERKRYLAELCVTGFIRICGGIDIPQSLEKLCLEMYYELVDTWDATDSDQGLKFDLENQIVIRPRGLESTWIIAKGTIIIRRGEVRTWKIKVLNPIQDVCFGISDIEAKTHVGYLADRLNSLGLGLDNGLLYSVDGFNGYAKQYTRHYINIDDVISMTVDMTGDTFGTVSYEIRDEYCGIAFDKINIDKQYTMAISMAMDDKIQLLQ